ncbi:hypothetical protein AWJ20_1170 [Sugiyamaella lignohabitans]|uniref:Sphingomyelin phosphodiesterase n=1 Tax=Sugiyamaella lignohabitans TaxID=796027 RepID=A0A167DGJ7_9ASCO|nr:uncharacterized protein AWJ20_1170 [Sugiyamaella lignohabitans]ANB12892.1 hypothetical protein AWJ20_1170 [Sugiyamaella lignohabitans]
MYKNSKNGDYCRVCKNGLELTKKVSLNSPESIPIFLRKICEHKKLAGTSRCDLKYYGSIQGEQSSFVTHLINVLTLMEPKGLDGEYFCHYILQGLCDLPTTPSYDLSTWWPPKPDSARIPPRSGKTFGVVHLSDIHLSTDYTVGSEGNCIGIMCCTPSSIRDPIQQPFPAPKMGYYNCDAPPALVDGSLAGLSNLYREGNLDYDFAIFTGDMVDHNPAWISYEQSLLEEEKVMNYLKKYLNNTPVYAVLGNHDSYPFSQVAQTSSGFADLFSFNTDLMAKLWEDNEWLNPATAKQARVHYGAYSTLTRQNLRIISLNSNFWYRWNFYNYWNIENPDTSGTLRFLVEELIRAENKGERVWVIAHVPPGGLSDEAMPIASQSLYQIFHRFSPETIAGLFFGHTHQDEFTVLYKHNATAKAIEDAINVAWIGPSVTPLSRYNPGFRFYKVDSGSFDIMEAYTFNAPLNDTFADDRELEWKYEYSAREEYDAYQAWPKSEPLNASFWHRVAEGIKNDPLMSQKYSDNAYRRSPYAPDCTRSHCRFDNYCYTTSMSTQQALQCRLDYGVHLRKLLTGGPTYPMPRPIRDIVERS